MTRTMKSMVGLALGCVIADAALADVPWNRRLGRLQTRRQSGSQGNRHTVWAEWTFDLASQNLTVLDLGTELEILVNGRPIADSQHFAVGVLPNSGFGCQGQQGNCGGDCGNTTVDGLANDLFCRRDAENDCNCGALWITSQPIPGVELNVGDEITVILYPAPGALPEGRTDDDSQTAVFVPCAGDVDGDYSVGLNDLARLLSNFGAQRASYADGDLNFDSEVDLTDLALLLSRFGAHC